MRPTRILLITLAALMFPVGLGAAVYATAGRSLAQPPEALVSVSSNPVAQPVTTTDDPTDISGPCDEAEHRNDPRCASGAAADDDGDDDGRHRNRGGGNDDRSGHSGNSGSGSADRGSDDSGSGSSGSGNSGSDDSGSDDSGSGGHGSDD
jgi:hypothetical protein